MKKILCILDSLDAGGAETFLMKIGRCIPKEKCQFDFILSKGEGIYIDEVLKRDGKIYVVPPRRKNLLSALWKIFSIVRKNNYNRILRLGDSPLLAIDLYAAKLGGAKYLGFRSCNALVGLSKKDKIIDCIMRPLLNTISNIKIAPSTEAAEFVFGKKQMSKVYLLHNGVDLNYFFFDKNGRNQIREGFKLKDKFVIGHIGRFHEQKNHKFLLEVFCEIKKIKENAVLMLVGIGELENKIKEEVLNLGIENSVIFTGLRFDIPQVLSAMDVFVFPSLYEGMPNTVIEAQATGLPCVISDTITKEAAITDKIQYLSLSLSPREWAENVVLWTSHIRTNEKSSFLLKGYDIKNVSKEILMLYDLV